MAGTDKTGTDTETDVGKTSGNGGTVVDGAGSGEALCENCGQLLLGPFCSQCGQSVKGLVRHFSSIMGDFADTVLNWDTRLPRTLWPLFGKPGYLTLEYFAGRRVRYVSPVRLFVTLSIVTFFIAQLILSFGDENLSFGNDGGKFADAATVEEVIARRDEALQELTKAREEINASVPGAGAGLIAAQNAIRSSAGKRITQLQAKPGSVAAGDDADDASGPTINFGNGGAWDPVTNPIKLAWMPGFANDWLNAMVGRAEKNIKRMQKDPDQFKDAVLGAVPSTLFILLPVFALMLKLLYLFKRRLYMEHLIVALHSHAFLCMSLLLIFLAMAVRTWLTTTGFVHGLFGWVEGLLWAWMPIYLLLMQKRVYAQGWLMTMLKFTVLGWCYVILLSIGSAFTVMASLVIG